MFYGRLFHSLIVEGTKEKKEACVKEHCEFYSGCVNCMELEIMMEL